MDESQTQDEPDVQDEAPEQIATTEVQPEAPVEESQEESTEAKVEETTEVAPEAEPQAYVPPQVANVPELKVGEDGTLDVNELNNWAKNVVNVAEQKSNAQVSRAQNETAQWDRLYETHPEIKGDKSMKDFIHKQRMGNMLTGGKDDVLGAYKGILKRMDASKQAGVKSQQESITRQKSANLQTASTSSNNDATRTKSQELLDLSASRNRRTADAARTELLKGMIERGEV